jgi:hypothetical protein
MTSMVEIENNRSISIGSEETRINGNGEKHQSGGSQRNISEKANKISAKRESGGIKPAWRQRRWRKSVGKRRGEKYRRKNNAAVTAAAASAKKRAAAVIKA